MKEGVYCPSCGRYVGPYFSCPYCGASINKRLSLRFLKYASIVLAVVGLVYLYWIAKNIQAPLVKIAAVRKTMNFALVRVKGNVEGMPYYNSDTRSFSFKLDDGTGKIWVSCYSNVAKELFEKGLIPLPGYRVEVEGPLSVKKDSLALTLNYWQKLKIISRPKIVYKGFPRRWSDLKVGKGIKLSGQITKNFSNQYVDSYFLSDGKKQIQMVIPQILRVAYDFPQLKVGDKIEVVGVLGKYKKYFQVIPFSPSSIKLLSHGKVEKNLSKTKFQEETLLLKVKSLRDFGKGAVLSGQRADGKLIDVVLWKDDVLYLPSIGSTIEVRGYFTVYRGKKQFKSRNLKITDFNFSSLPYIKVEETGNYIKQPIKIKAKMEERKIGRDEVELKILTGNGRKKIIKIDKKDFLHIPNNGLLRGGNYVDAIVVPLSKETLKLYFPQRVKVKKGENK